MQNFTIKLGSYEYVIAAQTYELAHLEAVKQHLALGRGFYE